MIMLLISVFGIFKCVTVIRERGVRKGEKKKETLNSFVSVADEHIRALNFSLANQTV